MRPQPRFPGASYRIDHGPDGLALPLVIASAGSPDVASLIAWLGERRAWLEELIVRHGALLLSGFDVADPVTFEAVARAVTPRLRNTYPGTPGNRLTEHVFPASELGGWFPIAQHCEMSFLSDPPGRVFFGCMEPPEPGSGETPITDFRRVWGDLDPAVRARFVERGVAVVRNYRGPASRRLRPWSLERWDEVFSTASRAVVEERCRQEGFTFEWTGDDGLRVVQTQPAARAHPVTGEPVWFNQAAAHHLDSSRHEYRRIFRLRPSLRAGVGWFLVSVQNALKRRTPRSRLAYFCTHADGSEIAAADMEALRETIWKNLVIRSWAAGDVLILDNRRVAHGRLPFRGRRRIVACLA